LNINFAYPLGSFRAFSCMLILHINRDDHEVLFSAFFEFSDTPLYLIIIFHSS